ncbi:tape measure protein [Mycolicibacterium wolinskyi]|uniref:tape measure protein n=1 Tax=Mycolicibacterium wolinskyi TaxID=59750 RepID=UPI0039178F7A
MANGIELAVAYVSLTGETRQLVRDINKAFAEADKSAARSAKTIGRNLESGLSGTKSSAARAGTEAAQAYERALKSSIRGERIGEAIGRPIGKGIGAGMKLGITAAAAGATAAVGALTYSLTSGFERLKNIDNARFKLKALGNSVEEVNTIMDSATESVKGTAFSLDKAANAAASSVAAGIKPGKELTKYLSVTADAAAVAGTSFEDMASIFNKVQTNGKAYTDDLQQLADRGLPIFTWLREQYGVTAEEFSKMVEDGEVDAASFQAAIETHIGGAAKEMGESLSGSIENMKASIARLGANLLSPILGMDPLKEGSDAAAAVQRITDELDEMGAWVVAHQDDIREYFDVGVDVARDLAGALGNVAGFLKQHPGLIQGAVIAFASWKALTIGAGAISSVTTALTGISTLLRTTLPASAAAGATAASVALGPFLGAIAAASAGLFALFSMGGPDVPARGQGESLDAWLARVGAAGINLPGLNPVPSQQSSEDLGGLLGVPAGPPPPDPTKIQGPVSGSGDIFGPGGVLGGVPSGTQVVAPSDLGGLLGVGSTSGGRPAPGQSLVKPAAGLTGAVVDQIAARFGLTKTSGTRPGDDGYHGSGQAGDYGGPVDKMRAFAAYMSQNFGSSLAEIIFDADGWAGNVKNGKVTGPFGNVYTMDQAGYHGDHVHIAWAKFDQGGWLQPGMTLAQNLTGKPELILTAEQLEELAKQGIDPATMQHGTAGPNYMPGPTPEQLHALGGDIAGPAGAQPSDLVRTEGYIPAGAGNTSVAGTSFVSGLYNMGAEAINGLIDQAASAAATAASAAATAGSFGAGGQAAGPAAAFAIGLGANAAKRGVSYGFEMLGIGTDALIEQLTPFGAPRWLSTDPTAFMPQGLMPAATTTLEKALQPGQQPEAAGQQPVGTQAPPQLQTPPQVNIQAPNPEDLHPAEGGGITIHGGINGMDPAGVVDELTRLQRRNALQYQGRP